MCTIELTVLRDHLRFKPETELHAAPMDLLRKSLDTSRQLLLIHDPVTQRGIIIIALAKPAIVEHHELNAKLSRTGSDLIDLLFIEVKIRSFPVVHKDRTQGFLVFAAQQMLAVKAMESL